MARLRAEGAEVAASVADVVSKSDILFLCLPSAKHVRAVFEGDGILQEHPERAGRRRSRHLVGQPDPRFRRTNAGQGRVLGRCADRAHAAGGAGRHAQRDGRRDACALTPTVEPLIRCFATDVTHCGDVGAGQVTKILNNMVLFETVNALAEAVAVAKHNGVDPKLLLETLSKGSADSFALRNHGMKAIVPGDFPERAFSTEYALKDLSYALELAGRCRAQDSRRAN